MANDIDDMTARIGALTDERTELETAIDEMIADMAEVPPEQRSASDWAPAGDKTQAYLKLTNRLADVEAEVITLRRAIQAEDEPKSPLQ